MSAHLLIFLPPQLQENRKGIVRHHPQYTLLTLVLCIGVAGEIRTPAGRILSSLSTACWITATYVGLTQSRTENKRLQI